MDALAASGYSQPYDPAASGPALPGPSPGSTPGAQAAAAAGALPSEASGAAPSAILGAMAAPAVSGGEQNTFLFPGQGSQAVGMMGEAAQQLPAVREMLEAARTVLGYDLLEVIKNGGWWRFGGFNGVITPCAVSKRAGLCELLQSSAPPQQGTRVQSHRAMHTCQTVQHAPHTRAPQSRHTHCCGPTNATTLSFSGPKEKLDDTIYAQPALLIADLAAAELLRARDPSAVASCGAAAGLSLGEYAALCWAGAISFEDALKVGCLPRWLAV